MSRFIQAFQALLEFTNRARACVPDSISTHPSGFSVIGISECFCFFSCVVTGAHALYYFRLRPPSTWFGTAGASFGTLWRMVSSYVTRECTDRQDAFPVLH